MVIHLGVCSGARANIAIVAFLSIVCLGIVVDAEIIGTARAVVGGGGHDDSGLQEVIR